VVKTSTITIPVPENAPILHFVQPNCLDKLVDTTQLKRLFHLVYADAALSSDGQHTMMDRRTHTSQHATTHSNYKAENSQVTICIILCKLCTH